MSIPSSLGQEPNVATQSGERRDMAADLELIADIRAGLPAIKKRRSRYLPIYRKESQDEYNRRVEAAPWRPEFVDGLLSLASKPFNKPVSLADDATPRMVEFSQDIDGRGNNLHVFAREAFVEAVANGVHLIQVSFPAGEWRNMAEQLAANPKPYWVHLPIEHVIAIYTDFVNGREVVTELRVRENRIERTGFEEKVIEGVRVTRAGEYELWENKKTTQTTHGPDDWQMVKSGPVNTVGGKPTTEVHVALLFTGKRDGAIKVKPPLRDLADMQIELYRALARQDEILTYAGSPMLCANGMTAPTPAGQGGDAEAGADIEVGPKRILFSPPTEGGRAGWSYVQPDAANIKEVREHVQAVIKDFRHLAMQPMVTRSGDVSATESAITGAKAHSQLESWALGLKDMLEQALRFTALWLGEAAAPGVQIHTDFGLGGQNTEEARVLADAEKRKVISKKTERTELKRRNILSADFDDAQEDEQIAIETEGLEPEEPIDPRGGNIIPFQEDAA